MPDLMSTIAPRSAMAPPCIPAGLAFLGRRMVPIVDVRSDVECMRREALRSGIMAGGTALGLMFVGALLLEMGANVRMGDVFPPADASPVFIDEPSRTAPGPDRVAMAGGHDIEYRRLE